MPFWFILNKQKSLFKFYHTYIFCLEPFLLESQIAGSQKAGSQIAGSQMYSKSQIAGSQIAGSQKAGSQIAGSQKAGSQNTGESSYGSQYSNFEKKISNLRFISFIMYIFRKSLLGCDFQEPNLY